MLKHMKIKIPMSRKAKKSPSPSPSPSSSYTSSSASSSSEDEEKQASNPNEQEECVDGGSESYEDEDDEPKNEPDNISIANNNNKKPRVKRIWSQQDEIAVLRGLVGYQRVNGPVPVTATAIRDFHAAIAGSLSINVSNSQLMDKMRRLRQRWRLASARGAPRPSRPHDQLVHELSGMAWGGGGREGVLRKYCPMLMEAVDGTGNMAAGEAVEAIGTARARGLEEKLKRRKVEGMMHHLLKMELQMETVKLIMDGIKNSSRY